MLNLKKLLTHTSLLSAYFILLAIAITFSSTIAYATEYYVAKSGKDTNPGTEASPFLSIKKGMTTMKAGDTLLIKAGTYDELIHSYRLKIPTGTSWADAPVIKAFPGDMVTVQPTGWAAVVDLADPYVQYVIFEGLIFDAINGDPDIGSAISLTNGANHVRFLNIEAKNSTANVVLLTPGSGGTDYNEFIGGNYHHSDIRHSTTLPAGNGAYIFYIISDHNLFEGMDIHHATGYGIRTWNTVDPRPAYNIIRNNRIHDNNLLKPSGSGLLLGSGVGNIAYNNLIFDNHGDGIQVQGGATGSLVYNNTIYNNGQDGIEIGDRWHVTANTVVKNNISYANGGSNYKILEAQAPGTIQSNNILDNTNPLFIDAANKNFRLNSGSPAINAGVTLAEVPIDFGRNARPQGTKYDIGAWEFTQSTVGTPMNFRLLSVR